MAKNYRVWKYNWNTKKAKNIDDFIEIFENITQVLKNLKKEGMDLDPKSKIDDDCITFYTINPEIVNEESFKQGDSDELREKIELFSDMLKIPVFSKDEIIRRRFFEGINACYGMELSRGMEPLVNFAIRSYQTENFKFTFVFWEFSYETIFPRFVKNTLLSNYIIGSREIVYFYHIDEKIDEDLLSCIKSNSNSKVPILFIGYDTVLPENPENSDKNIPIIQKYYNSFDSFYLSTDDQG